MAGAPLNREPKEWAKLDTTKALMEVLQEPQMGKNPDWKVIISARGHNAGTWAVRGLTLAYAKYISPEFHAACRMVIKARIEEEANLELAIKRAKARTVNTWKLRGKTAG